MSTSEVVLAVLRRGPAHGYDVKRDHDRWFPDSRPLAYGQVYATLSRLERDGLIQVVETRTEGGPERTVYAMTDAGDAELTAWLEEPAAVGGSGADEIVRKTVAALRTGDDPRPYLAAQRTAHLRRMRELADQPLGVGPGQRLARDHLVAHLDADLRWLEQAVERFTTAGAAAATARAGIASTSTPTNGDHS